MTIVYTLGSVLAVSALSLIGVFFFLVQDRLIRRALLFLVSFSSGALLGDVFIHLLPTITQSPAPSRGFLVVLGGIVFSFIAEKIIHWRHCHLLPEDEREHGHRHDLGAMSLFGDSVHNFIDGLAIAASFLVSVPVGISTTIAVVFHEIPDEIGHYAILLHSGYTRRQALLWNGLSALTAVAGALVALLGQNSFQSLNDFLLPFAAGNLLYIAGSDLIPELHREEGIGNGVIQLLCMVAGIGIMCGMLFVE